MSFDPLAFALGASNASARLQAALSTGIRADPSSVGALLERCAVEPDFSVRDTLTWALVRLPADVTVPRLLAELDSPVAQARSQAFHTLSKIGDPRAWPAVASGVHDRDDEVARASWRAAAGLAPSAARGALAAELVRELGRGGQDAQRSLSRAIVALGEAAAPALAEAAATGPVAHRAHAAATQRLLEHPDDDFGPALAHATRLALLGPGSRPDASLLIQDQLSVLDDE